MFKLNIAIIFLLIQSICFCIYPYSFGFNDNQKIRVDSIVITGNSVTQDKIILRELTFKVGDYVNMEDLQYNRERIYSLGLFNNVTIIPVLKDENTNIAITVEESWYIWPIPILDLRDSELRKLTLGINLLYKNFRGMNETVSSIFAFGYDPFFNLSYYNPWLIREDNISLSLGISYNKIHNISPMAEYFYGSDFTYKHISGYINTGKRFNIYNELYFLLGYDYVEQPLLIKKIPTASNGRVDRMIKSGIDYIFDSRNLKQFADSGFYANLNYTHRGFGLNNINFSSFDMDLRYYLKVTDGLTMKLRNRNRFTFGGSVPFYDHSFLGYGERIRGHYNDIREGNNLYVFSIDMRYPIIKEWLFSIKLPLIPKELTTYRIGIYADAFGNTGATQFNNKTLGVNDFYSGYGAGLLFAVLPYNIASVFYAMNEYEKGEIIFELGFTF